MRNCLWNLKQQNKVRYVVFFPWSLFLYTFAWEIHPAAIIAWLISGELWFLYVFVRYGYIYHCRWKKWDMLDFFLQHLGVRWFAILNWGGDFLLRRPRLVWRNGPLFMCVQKFCKKKFIGVLYKYYTSKKIRTIADFLHSKVNFSYLFALYNDNIVILEVSILNLFLGTDLEGNPSPWMISKLQLLYVLPSRRPHFQSLYMICTR